MEAAGLALALPALFSLCMEIVERVDAYKEFGLEARRAVTQFDADKLRLRKWAQDAGIEDGKWNEKRDPRLQDPEVAVVVGNILHNACEIFEAVEHSRSQVRVKPTAGEQGAFKMLDSTLHHRTPGRSKEHAKESVRAGLGWSLKRRGRFTNQVEMFKQTVDSLYALVSPVAEVGLVRRATGLIDDGEQPLRGAALREWQADVRRMLADTRERMREQALLAVNKYLDLEKFEQQYNVQQYYNKQILLHLEGTCDWILQTTEYSQWESDETDGGTSKILWVSGRAGFGKTVLAARIIDRFMTTHNVPIAYFFSSSNAFAAGDLTYILRSWIGQIVRRNEEALELIRGWSEGDQTKTTASIKDVWSIFKSILSLEPGITLFLDGLDEYPRELDNRSDFLCQVKDTIAGTGARLFISSREEVDIKLQLSSTTVDAAEELPEQILLGIRLTEDKVRDDVQHYSKSVVDKRLPKKDDDLRSKLADRLSQRCEGMFLWIKMQQEQLRGGKNSKQLEKIVENMPAGLEATYERAWANILDRPPDEQQRAFSILRWATFALRPLTVREISEALVVDTEVSDAELPLDDLPDEINDDYVNDEIIDLCGSLVEARSGSDDKVALKTIHLVHMSVREFLLTTLPSHSRHHGSQESLQDYMRNNQRPPMQLQHHNLLAQTCLAYLGYNSVWQSSPDLLQDPHDAAGDQQGTAFLDYAAKLWPQHVKLAGQVDAKTDLIMEDFFNSENENFTNWAKYVEGQPSEQDDGERQPVGTPMYYATLYSLPQVLDSIWARDKSQLDVVGGSFGTPLAAACACSHQALFQKLIDWGADPNASAGHHGGAVLAAVQRGSKSMLEVLLAHGANLNVQDAVGRTVLHVVAQDESRDSALAATFSQTALDARLERPLNDTLQPAIWLDIACYLMEKGAPLNVQNNAGSTALEGAAISGNCELMRQFLVHGADASIGCPLSTASTKGHLDIVRILLDHGADVNGIDRDGNSPLLAAVHKGFLGIAELLLERGANLEFARANGDTALLIASGASKPPMLKLLLDRGANVLVRNQRNQSPMYAAAHAGLSNVRMLLEHGAEVDVQSDNGSTALYVAVRSNLINTAKLLLDRGANLATRSRNDWQPIHAAAENGHVVLLKLLLERGAEPNAVARYGNTPLSIAAANNELEAVQFLLQHGADITFLDEDGWTLVNNAANDGHIDVIRLLHTNGADMTSPDSEGWSPLLSAADEGHLEILKYLLGLESATFDINASNVQGWTLFTAAADSGHIEVVEYLLERGADASQPGPNEQTAIYLAADSGHLAMVQLLLTKGVSIHVFDEWGQTPLHAAAMSGHTDIVRLLLDQGADGNIASEERLTPLTVAAARGHIETVRFLLERLPMSVTQTSGQLSPLFGAIEYGYIDVVKLLLDAGFDPNIVDTDGNSTLHEAAKYGEVEIAKLLVELGVSADSPDQHGWTPLNYATVNGTLETIRILVGVETTDIQRLDREGRNLLHLAARSGELTCVEYFLQQGLDIAAQDVVGNDALFHACCSGSYEVVKHIWELGHSYNLVTKPWSLLHWAYRYGDQRLVDFLRTQGVTDTTVRTNHPPGLWKPASVGMWHCNPHFSQEELEHAMDKTSTLAEKAEDMEIEQQFEAIHISSDDEAGQEGLSPKVNDAHWLPGLVQTRELRKKNMFCEYCCSELFGQYFESTTLEDRTICIMCHVFREIIFPGEEWTIRKVEEQDSESETDSESDTDTASDTDTDETDTDEETDTDDEANT